MVYAMALDDIDPSVNLDAEDMADLHQMLRQYRSGRAVWKVIMMLGGGVAGLVGVLYALTQIWQFFWPKGTH